MWGFHNYDRVELNLEDGKIKFLKNLKHIKYPNDFEPKFKKKQKLQKFIY